ncbi:hypothetical protein Ciccas_013369, partial [Cichlidogyrus casuarinus]
TWNDTRLKWDKDHFNGISSVQLHGKDIWLPDVGVLSSKSSDDFDFSSQTKFGRVKVSHEGVVDWLHGAVLDLSCPLDVTFFPFDYQTCYLILAPWSSTIEHLTLSFSGSKTPSVDNEFLPNSNVSEWEIVKLAFENKDYIDSSDPPGRYQYVQLAIHLKRQPLYFIVLVLVPFSMLSALACLIFTLDDTGDRLSVALSLVLSMTMYVVIVSSNAPRSMKTIPVMG